MNAASNGYRPTAIPSYRPTALPSDRLTARPSALYGSLMAINMLGA